MFFLASGEVEPLLAYAAALPCGLLHSSCWPGGCARLISTMSAAM